MDLKQVEYIIKIAEENNITKAAEKLFITQSALNQQLLKLEKELGTQLFVRSRSNWRLTASGQVYIENAKKMINIKKDTYNQINDLIDVKKGKLIVGLTPERGPEMFAAIYPPFYQQYPHIKIEPVEMTVKQQQLEITNGNLDLGFLTLQDFQKTNNEYIHIGSEQIVVAVSRMHDLFYSDSLFNENLPSVNLSRFKNDPFAIMQKGTTLREICDRLFDKEGINPAILLETRSGFNLRKMVEEGICCSIFPITYAQPSDDIAYFSIADKTSWEICASYKKGSYLNKAAQDFIALARQYWSKKLPHYCS